MVMALKKGNCEKGSKKKCCVACSVGKECLKYEPEEDDVELMVAGRFSLVSGRTQGRTGGG